MIKSPQKIKQKKQRKKSKGSRRKNSELRTKKKQIKFYTVGTIRIEFVKKALDLDRQLPVTRKSKFKFHCNFKFELEIPERSFFNAKCDLQKKNLQ